MWTQAVALQCPLTGGSNMIQNNNAPEYKVNSVNTGFGVQQLKWPTQSLELNPTKQTPLGWTGTVSLCSSSPHPTSGPYLTNACVDEWANPHSHALNPSGKPQSEKGCLACTYGCDSEVSSNFLPYCVYTTHIFQSIIFCWRKCY